MKNMEKIGVIFSGFLIVITIFFMFQSGYLISSDPSIKTGIKPTSSYTIVSTMQGMSTIIPEAQKSQETIAIEEKNRSMKILGSIQSLDYIVNDQDIYYIRGKISITSGIFYSVIIIIRYPNSQEYIFDNGGMGGSNATEKQFTLFPDLRYAGRLPKYFIKADDKEYEAKLSVTNDSWFIYEQ